MAHVEYPCSNRELLDEVYETAHTAALQGDQLDLDKIAEPYIVDQGELGVCQLYGQDVYNALTDPVQRLLVKVNSDINGEAIKKTTLAGSLIGAVAGYSVERILGGEGIIFGATGIVVGGAIGGLIEKATRRLARKIAGREDLADLVCNTFDFKRRYKKAFKELSKL